MSKKSFEIIEDFVMAREKLEPYLQEHGAVLAEQSKTRLVFSVTNNQSLIVTGHKDGVRIQRVQVPCAC